MSMRPRYGQELAVVVAEREAIINKIESILAGDYCNAKAVN